MSINIGFSHVHGCAAHILERKEAYERISSYNIPLQRSIFRDIRPYSSKQFAATINYFQGRLGW